MSTDNSKSQNEANPHYIPQYENVWQNRQQAEVSVVLTTVPVIEMCFDEVWCQRGAHDYLNQQDLPILTAGYSHIDVLAPHPGSESV